MKPGVHRRLCESNAVCVALAPSLFDLDDTGLAVPILDAVSEPDVESLRMAVDGCPRAAVFIADDE